MLVGNKIDLEANRAVSDEQGKNFADQNNLMFSETSANNGDNIKETFNALLSRVLDNIKKYERSTLKNPSLVANENALDNYRKSLNSKLSQSFNEGSKKKG